LLADTLSLRLLGQPLQPRGLQSPKTDMSAAKLKSPPAKADGCRLSPRRG
jgi:hypothetical protein